MDRPEQGHHRFTEKGRTVLNVSLILLVAIGLAFALLLGAITNRLGLSPRSLGTCLPASWSRPIRQASSVMQRSRPSLRSWAAILLMPGVGLHFHIKDLIRVREVALPGAVG